ncbi:MAG: hypothetical protein JW852_10405, partial [Spirochaetales bacterium]|nr:hypothetical protein [Spirochaetales bacterium]
RRALLSHSQKVWCAKQAQRSDSNESVYSIMCIAGDNRLGLRLQKKEHAAEMRKEGMVTGMVGEDVLSADVRRTGAGGTLVCGTRSGSITVRNAFIESAELSSGMGDIRIDCELSQAGKIRTNEKDRSRPSGIVPKRRSRIARGRAGRAGQPGAGPFP